jgi:hypothetical protein
LIVQRWLTLDQQEELTEVAASLQALGVEARVFTYNQQTELAQWMQDYMDDGVCDALLLMDVVPAVIYSGQDDGSLAEQWMEHGNGIIWTGQRSFSEYLFPNAVTSTDGAGVNGADDVLDAVVPQISGGIGTMFLRKDSGDLPSLKKFYARLAVRYDQIGADWRVDKLYVTDNDHDSDGLALRHRSGGFYAQFYSSFRTDIPRTAVLEEFIHSYVLGRLQVPDHPSAGTR